MRSLLAGALLALALLVWTRPGDLAARRVVAVAGPAADPAAVLLAWVRRVLGAHRPGARAARRSARGEASAVADLLAACLSAGCAPLDAAAAVAAARPGPLAAHLDHAVARIRSGAEPGAWLELAAEPELAALGRALARAADSGVSAAGAIAALARRQRLAARLDADAAIARVGVLAAAPLGLCFLPAFLCLGVLPVVLGLGAGVFDGAT